MCAPYKPNTRALARTHTHTHSTRLDRAHTCIRAQIQRRAALAASDENKFRRPATAANVLLASCLTFLLSARLACALFVSVCGVEVAARRSGVKKIASNSL